MQPIAGTREYAAVIRYFERGKMQRFETTLHSNSMTGASLAAQKILFSEHAGAVPMSVEIVDVIYKALTIPRLVVDNPRPTKKKD